MDVQCCTLGGRRDRNDHPATTFISCLLLNAQQAGPGSYPNRREYAEYEPEVDVSDSIRNTEQGKSQTARHYAAELRPREILRSIVALAYTL